MSGGVECSQRERERERERERLTCDALLEVMLEWETVAVEVELRYIPPPYCVCHVLREGERDHR